MKFLFVALGGGLGAVLRYMISLIPIKMNYPILTLCTNFLGAVLIGVVVGFISSDKIGENQSLFWKTGVCGGFTTFSTFSLEAVNLLESGRVAAGCSYMGLSLVLCLAGVVLGRQVSLWMQ